MSFLIDLRTTDPMRWFQIQKLQKKPPTLGRPTKSTSDFIRSIGVADGPAPHTSRSASVPCESPTNRTLKMEFRLQRHDVSADPGPFRADSVNEQPENHAVRGRLTRERIASRASRTIGHSQVRHSIAGGRLGEGVHFSIGSLISMTFSPGSTTTS